MTISRVPTNSRVFRIRREGLTIKLDSPVSPVGTFGLQEPSPLRRDAWIESRALTCNQKNSNIREVLSSAIGCGFCYSTKLFHASTFSTVVPLRLLIRLRGNWQRMHLNLSSFNNLYSYYLSLKDCFKSAGITTFVLRTVRKFTYC